MPSKLQEPFWYKPFREKFSENMFEWDDLTTNVQEFIMGEYELMKILGEQTFTEFYDVLYKGHGERAAELAEKYLPIASKAWDKFPYLCRSIFINETRKIQELGRDAEEQKKYPWAPDFYKLNDLMIFVVLSMCPNTSLHEEYLAYLQSPEWKAKAEKIKEKYGYRCAVCNKSKFLNVHHRTYENLYNEPEEDLICLCNKCHAKFHGKEVEP